MNTPIQHQPDSRLDLVLERIVDVPRELVWAAWTQPENIKKWFTPVPWKTIDCEIDLRPGGMFRTVMQSPEGEEFPTDGCYLEIVENERLIWTGALAPGYRPRESSEMAFTAVITMEPVTGGTAYKVIVLHRDEADCKKHEEMGFEEGWGKALDQLVALMKAA